MFRHACRFKGVSAKTLILLALTLFLPVLTASCKRRSHVHNRHELAIPESRLMIRVMIVPHGRTARIFCDVPFKIVANDDEKRRLNKNNFTVRKGAEISAIPGGISIGPVKIYGQSFRLVPLEKEPIEIYETEKMRFYGDLIFYRNDIDNTVDIVNEVGLEDYLIGVLGREVAANWPMESLKAQAIAARTRVLFQREFARKLGDRFDVRCDTKDQVYGGVPPGPYGRRIEQAVKMTAGQVLTFNGAIFKIYFSSTCGGCTETAERVFHSRPGSHPAGAIKCPYCKASPVFNWRHRIKTSEALRRINQYSDTQLETITAIRPLKTDLAGHALSLEIVGKNKTLTFGNAYKFRTNTLGRCSRTEVWRDGGWHRASQIDPKHIEIIMSTSFTAKINGDYIEFTGKGWGHGVGLCQFGAKALAEDGADCRKILAFYFPGTFIARNYNNQVTK